jgi:hypothetical protein
MESNNNHGFLTALVPYYEAFAERDADRRLALLAAAMTPDAEIWGPQRVFAGYGEIAQKIERFQLNWPGCRLVLSSGLNVFRNCERLAGAIVDAQGQVRARGQAFVELAADGRIRRVVPFWDELPPLPQDWPARLAAP